MRKLISLLLCVMLLVSMTIPAHAEDTQQPSTDGSEPVQTEHVCSWDQGTVTTAATCTADGVMTYTCTGCGTQKTETIPASGHTYGPGVKVDDSTHEATCGTCGTKSSFSHSWQVSQTVEPTCQQTGLKSYICTGCNATKEETLEKTAHDYVINSFDDVCHTLICDDCGHQEIKDHDKSVQETPATCKAKGHKITTCTVCSWKVEEELPMLTTHTYDNDCDASCNVCGATREVEHKYTTTWSSDHTGHWHECTICKVAKKDYKAHVPGPAATEDNAQICTVCKYQIRAALPHNHKYDNQWSTDEVGHWHECTGKNCKNEKDYGSHEYDSDCDDTCNVCGYERVAPHSYEEVWKSDDAEHWKVCTVCEQDSEHEGHIPGEEATDETPQLCTVCEYELVPIQEHVHDFGNDWIQSVETHWQECKCGEQSVPEPHVWDAGVEDRKADLIIYGCTVCGAEKTEPIPSSGFPWIIVFILLALLCVGGIVAIVIILKRTELEEDDDEDDDE